MEFSVKPIGYVQASRTTPEDDFWGNEQSCIVLEPSFTAEALQGLAEFSHAEIVFLFHEVASEKIVTAARHPRNTRDWPAVGIFSQRGKNRPNRLGTTICRIVGVEETRLYVAELDAIDGTPVIDIKPVMDEFLPREEVRQPRWATELMSSYWLKRSD
ncbi:MAG TPA: SAM-dependent methyltransferase [Pyrinomonadaceae bacterium]